MKFLFSSLFLIAILGPLVQGKVKTHRVSSRAHPYYSRYEIVLKELNADQNEGETTFDKNPAETQSSDRVVLTHRDLKIQTGLDTRKDRKDNGNASLSEKKENTDQSASKTFEGKQKRNPNQTPPPEYGNLLKRHVHNKGQQRSIRHKILKAIGKANITLLPKSKGVFNELVEKTAWFYTKHPELLTPQPEMHCYKAQCSFLESTNEGLWQSKTNSLLRLNFRLPRLTKKSKTRVKSARLHVFVTPSKGCRECHKTRPESPDNMLISAIRYRRSLSYKKRNRKVRSCHQLTGNRTHPPTPMHPINTNPYIDVVTKKIQTTSDIEAVAKRLIFTLKNQGLVQKEEPPNKERTSELKRKFKEIKRSMDTILAILERTKLTPEKPLDSF